MTYTARRTRQLSDDRRRRSYSPAGRQNRFPQQRGFMRSGSKLDPARLIKRAEGFEEEDAYQAQHTFDDFAIRQELKDAVKRRGYISPTPIQDQAIPHILSGRDVVGIANTGTGKTAAFLLPLMNKILEDMSQKALIIAPTRELAVQIQEEAMILSSGTGIRSVLCIGGVSMRRQEWELRNKPNLVIGTPGRLKDLNKQHFLYFGFYNSIVLDEVDRMLDMGFIHDVRFIVSKLSKPRQSLFFSATLPKDVELVMRDFLTNPIQISVKTRETSKNIDQDVIRTQGKAKIDVLHDLLIQKEFQKVLVFGRTKWGMEKLAKSLTQRGFKAASIHGNKNQAQRQRAIQEFKENKVQILIATDIASRGLDIPNVTHVINYDLPESYEDYVHRIGRTGRAEKAGKALSFIDGH